MTDDYTYETCHNSDTHEQMQLTIHCATYYTACYTAHYKQNQYGSKNNNYSFHDNQFFRMLLFITKKELQLFFYFLFQIIRVFHQRRHPCSNISFKIVRMS